MAHSAPGSHTSRRVPRPMLGAGVAVAVVLAVTIGVLVVNAGGDDGGDSAGAVEVEPLTTPTGVPKRAPTRTATVRPTPTVEPSATSEGEVQAEDSDPSLLIVPEDGEPNVEPVLTPTPVPFASPPPPSDPPPPAGSLTGQRVYANGDSTSYFMSVSVLNTAVAMGGIQVQPVPEYQISSGLLNTNYFDWYGYLASDMATYNPDVVVFMIGANDAYAGMDLGLYRARVGLLMDQLSGRRVIWAGQPNMGRADLVAAIPVMNQVFAEEAGKRPWVRYVDTWSLTSDANGNFTPYLPDGTLARASDGVHFTSAGGNYLAQAVISAILGG